VSRRNALKAVNFMLLLGLVVPMVSPVPAHAAVTATSNSSLGASVLSLRMEERSFVREMRAAIPSLKTHTNGKILRIGRNVCRLYKENGKAPWVTRAIKTGMRDLISPSSANLVIQSATDNLCPRFAGEPARPTPSTVPEAPGVDAESQSIDARTAMMAVIFQSQQSCSAVSGTVGSRPVSVSENFREFRGSVGSQRVDVTYNNLTRGFWGSVGSQRVDVTYNDLSREFWGRLGDERVSLVCRSR
jgi:hypothetical protein